MFFFNIFIILKLILIRFIYFNNFKYFVFNFYSISISNFYDYNFITILLIYKNKFKIFSIIIINEDYYFNNNK